MCACFSGNLMEKVDYLHCASEMVGAWADCTLILCSLQCRITHSCSHRLRKRVLFEGIALFFSRHPLAALCIMCLHYFIVGSDTYFSRSNDRDSCCCIAKQCHQSCVKQ